MVERVSPYWFYETIRQYFIPGLIRLMMQNLGLGHMLKEASSQDL